MSFIDWNLVLEFVKALAGPTATLLAAIVVAILGVRTFRRQKRLERRLEWYERTHRRIGEMRNAFMEPYGDAIQNPSRQEKLSIEEVKRLDALIGRLSGRLINDLALAELYS